MSAATLWLLKGRLDELERLRECGALCVGLAGVMRWSERQMREMREDMSAIDVEFTEIIVRIALMRRECVGRIS